MQRGTKWDTLTVAFQDVLPELLSSVDLIVGQRVSPLNCGLVDALQCYIVKTEVSYLVLGRTIEK